jgi:hypothetical protein
LPRIHGPVVGLVSTAWEETATGLDLPSPGKYSLQLGAVSAWYQAAAGVPGSNRQRMLGHLLLWAWFHTELVALRISHHRVAWVPLDHAGTQFLQSRHFRGHVARGAQVEMQPVLGGFGLRYLGEPDVRAAPSRGFDERLVRGGILINVRAEDSRPELGQDECIGSVERHGLDHTRHARKPSPAHSGNATGFAFALHEDRGIGLKYDF